VRVLVLNAGSATLKAALVEPPGRERAFEQTVDWSTDDGSEAGRLETVRAVIEAAGAVDAVGHRVVHGGARFTGPTRLDDATIDELAALDDLAPLHNPVAVATIRAARRLLPGFPQVAAFDTAFHAGLPEVARRYPVPDSWLAAGVRRYGFHGLSVAWATQRAAELLAMPVAELRVVVAHLGGGCSVSAVDGGRSVDTSMGMTPLEGLMMGSRAGSIDPGILFRLLRVGRPAAELEEDLDRRSGLVAIGGTNDMARLLAAEAGGDGGAALALEMFVRRAAAGIAASTTTLPAVDAVVFTGGIGEHAPSIRGRIVERLHLVGGEATEQEVEGDLVVRRERGPVELRIAAREDLVIAGQAMTVLGA
jgi:acetate kinase